VRESRAPGHWAACRVRFAQPSVVARVRKQRCPLFSDSFVEQRAGLLEGAVEATARPQLPALLAHPTQHVLKTAKPRRALAKQVTQRVGGVGSVEHGIAEFVEGAGDVVRRRERIGALVPRTVPKGR